MSEPNSLRIGTSAFTANGWRGTFYPEGMRPADYLSYYATKFDTVEVDSTFYGSPTISTVEAWDAKTPPGFIFAAKVPQTITHEKLLVDCDISPGCLVHESVEQRLANASLRYEPRNLPEQRRITKNHCGNDSAAV